MTKQTFTLTFEGQRMHVSYTPHYLTDYGHFAFSSPYDPPRRIPVSETGYRSHFAPMWEIQEASSPEIYAEAVVRALLNAKKKKPDAESDRQPALF